jgi:DNA repair exonuclease SbcCD ATPase subunit
MPYKDPEKKKANAKRRTERAKIRRVADPEFAAKEKEARKKWYKKRYHAQDDEYKRNRNAKRVVSRYGLTVEEYNKLLEQQGYACAICGTPHYDESGKRLSIDHNHAKGLTAIRGLLCANCNFGLGLFKDSPTILRAAAEYLE